MKIVRHVARDMRQAMRAIRERLGEDAVILSSRRVSDGVEVTAAIDFDAESLEGAPVQPLVDAPESPLLRRDTHAARRDAALVRRETPPIKDEDAPVHSKVPPALDALPTYEPTPAAQRFEAGSPLISRELQSALLDSLVVRNEERPRAAPPAVAQAKTAANAGQPARAPAAVARLEAQAAYATQPLDFDLTEPTEAPRGSRATHHLAEADAIGTELKSLRRMLETQLAQLAWNDMTRRAPVHTEMLRELSEIGIAQDLSSQITQQLSQDVELTYARRFSIAALSQYLLVTGDRWLDNGGRIAFIGATGVGKTMTLSKLAVRWVLRHGARDLALVAADNIRLGAQDQMRALGQLLGAPVYTPENFETLPTLLSNLQQRFILIDTPGSGLRDTQLSSRLAVLASSASQLQTALVLAASTQAGALEEVVKRFAPANPGCCVLTKVDEAASLGGALSVLIRARVPVSYVSEGQRVPEDLRPARALELVSHAVRLAKATGAAADEDLLRRRFGKTANAAT
jgi:flagellar biosynthesis protein FlhF